MTPKKFLKKSLISALALCMLFTGLILTGVITPTRASQPGVTFSTNGVSGNLTPGIVITMKVMADAAVPYNAVTGKLKFTNFEFVGATSDSIWSLKIAEPGLSTKETNTVEFTGAIPGNSTPNSVTGKRDVMTVQLRAPQTGSASFTVLGAVALYENGQQLLDNTGQTVTYSISGNPTSTVAIDPCGSAKYKKAMGNANCDEYIDLLDFGIFRTEFILMKAKPTPKPQLQADFDLDGNVDLIDFGMFRTGFIETHKVPTP